MEAVVPEGRGAGDAPQSPPEARVHFRVTRFIMEAGNCGREEGRAPPGRGCGTPLPATGLASLTNGPCPVSRAPLPRPPGRCAPIQPAPMGAADAAVPVSDLHCPKR